MKFIFKSNEFNCLCMALFFHVLRNMWIKVDLAGIVVDLNKSSKTVKCASVAEWIRSWTRDQKVVGLIPSRVWLWVLSKLTSK